jgi:hypothetical protein
MTRREDCKKGDLVGAGQTLGDQGKMGKDKKSKGDASVEVSII